MKIFYLQFWKKLGDGVDLLGEGVDLLGDGENLLGDGGGFSQKTGILTNYG